MYSNDCFYSDSADVLFCSYIVTTHFISSSIIEAGQLYMQFVLNSGHCGHK